MREIKFRAWALDYPNCIDGKLPHKMFYDVGVGDFRDTKWQYIVRTSKYVDYSSGDSKPEDYDNVKWFDFDCKLMQYTGLKDNDDRKIYEGDILELTLNLETVEDEYFSQTNAAVEWDLDHWQIGDYNLSYYANSDDFDRYCKVIGNIYQNPELLEAKS